MSLEDLVLDQEYAKAVRPDGSLIMSIKRDGIMEKFAELLSANDRIALDCKAAMTLVHDPEVVKAYHFLTRLDELADKYQFKDKDIILLLDPSYGGGHPNYGPQDHQPLPKTKRKPRPVKFYRNPHTGETLQTKGANHNRLKEWKAAHGAKVVEGWLVE